MGERMGGGRGRGGSRDEREEREEVAVLVKVR